MIDRALIQATYELAAAIHARTLRCESLLENIVSNTDPLAAEISTLTTDVGSLQTQNAALITLVQKLASSAGVNTAADLAALQAVDTTVTGITAADVAAVVGQSTGTAPPVTATPTAPTPPPPPTT